MKVGDVVICIDDTYAYYPGGKLIKGKSYKIKFKEPGIIKIKGSDILWDEKRFQLSVPLEETKQTDLTLPTDSNKRKEYPMFRGVLKYFPAALAGVANISKTGNDKHNPGEELHHARGKSPDHGDCVIRHLMDTADLLAAMERDNKITPQEILNEANQLAWRALAFSQELHEKFGAPMAPGAKK